MARAAQPEMLPRDDTGAPAGVLGGYGANQDGGEPQEFFRVTAVTRGAIVNVTGSFGNLVPGAVYEMHAGSTSANDLLHYEFSAADGGAPVPTTSDIFWPIGQLGLYRFKALPGQEQLKIIIDNGTATGTVSFSIQRMR